MIKCYQTLKYLKWSQIVGRFSYRIKRTTSDYSKYYKPNSRQSLIRKIELVKPINKYNTYTNPHTFIYINKEKKFQGSIDWNYKGFGRLWTYNLNYFDFINQENIYNNDAHYLIRDYIRKESNLVDGKEPYPVSLRLVNWLKFLQINKIDDQELNNFIIGDLKNLEDNLEYHLLGNHLLENAFALTIGGYCYELNGIYRKGKNLLFEQLAIQICSDGAHYELSPMYHQIILERLMDTINFLEQNEAKELIIIAERMLSWLDNITFKDGDIPMLSDTAPGIAPSSSEIFNYARRLGINYKKIPLSDSGIRYFHKGNYECIIDGGGLGPEYHTGHGHSDAGTFLLRYMGRDVVVDTGISTYGENERRLLEKSVESHNTTHPKGVEPSEMWKSFRVARRESVFIKNECEDSVTIKRNLPYKIKYSCSRKFTFLNQQINILDQCETDSLEKVFCAYIHFAPGIVIKLREDGIIDLEFLSIKIIGSNKIRLASFYKADGYNNLVKSRKLVIEFENVLKTEINIKTAH